jgi:hypothetical protein
MIGKAPFDERHHRSCRFVRRKPPPRRWNSTCRKPLAIRPVIVPFAACRLIAFHEEPMFAPHLAIKMFHPPAAAPGSPGSEPRTAREEAMIGTDFDRLAGEGSPAIDQRLDAPFRRFRYHNADRAMPRNGALDLGCEAAGIVGRVEPYIVDFQTALAERLGEVAHRRQHQNDLLLVMPDVGVFFHHLHHQDGVTACIEVVQRGQVQRQLVSENNSQDGHDGATPGPDAGRGYIARQRSEQYFTFTQSRSHFFRQTKDRPQTTQSLVGRSVLRRIRAIGSPRHWLAAPVEKFAVGVRRELIDDGEKMSGRSRGRMNLQPGRRERSGQRRGDRAGMQGDAKCVWRSTGQFNSRCPNQLIESGFGSPVGIPAAQPIIADASDPGRQRREDDFARPRQPRQHMLHDQRWSDRIQRKGSSEVDRIELPPALLRPLVIIVQKSRGIDHEAKLALIGGKCRSAFETGLVQKVDRRRSAAAERNDTFETFCDPNGLDQCPSDSAARAEDDRDPGLRKRPKVKPGDGCGLGLELLSHRSFAPSKTDCSFRIRPKTREMIGRTGRNIR